MIALAETVRAFGKHAQRSEVAAEYQPDELQHEKQRHANNLQLLEELLPKPVLSLDRTHDGTELPVAHSARTHVNALLRVVDGGDSCEPSRRVENIRQVLTDQVLAFLVGPRQAVDLAPFDLVFQQLPDLLVIADERLIGNQRCDESERLLLLTQQTRGIFPGALRQKQRGLHAARGDDRDPDGEHEAGNQSPIAPEAKRA